MALMTVILIIVAMIFFGEKGKAHREDQRRKWLNSQKTWADLPEEMSLSKEEVEERKRKIKEDQYRQDLEAQGYDEQLITVILPTLMNDGK